MFGGRSAQGRERMRDQRFFANHMGGPLSLERHRSLIHWAVDCVKHGIEIANETEIDKRAFKALGIAEKWEKGNATVGEAREAAFAAHDAARECEDKIKQALMRACGHAVATAHMADHSLQARVYIFKALKLKNIEIEKEIEWQIQKADAIIKDLVE
jgi:hypothetical protein